MDQQTVPAADDAAPLAPRLTMRRVIRDAFTHFFDLESGWMRTFRDLSFAPGAMIRRYVQGHRKVYANPFAYLVLATAVSIVVQKVFGFQERLISSASAGSVKSPLQVEFINSFSELVFQNTLYISFGILVPMAILTRLFFRRSGYNLAECFVFALYSGGHTALLSAILAPAAILLPPSAALLGIASVSFAIAYVIYAAHGFFNGHPLVVAIKMGIAYVTAYVLFMVVMMAIVIAYIFKVMVPASSGVPWDVVTATQYEAAPVIEELLDEGADVNATMQRTALHEAAARGNLEIVELLIRHGADVNLQDIHGRIPLFVALAEHQPEVARRLAKEETDVRLRATDGGTLLTAAVRFGELEMVQWAIDQGVDVDAIRPEKNYATALMRAAAEGKPEIVALLLEHGADPKITNHQGKTALDLAKGKTVRTLLQNRVDHPPSTVAPGADGS